MYHACHQSPIPIRSHLPLDTFCAAADTGVIGGNEEDAEGGQCHFRNRVSRSNSVRVTVLEVVSGGIAPVSR